VLTDGGMLSDLTKLNFRLKAIKLPVSWQKPEQGDPWDMYQYALPEFDGPDPMRLFTPATIQKFHVKAVKDVSQLYEDYIDGITGAIAGAVGDFMKQCQFTAGIITGPVGVITPGSLQGPPIGDPIKANGPRATEMEGKYTDAIGKTLGMAWKAWHMGAAGVVPFPPTFAACPSPVHPPTPNIPLPIIALPSPGLSLMLPAALKQVMILQLNIAEAIHHIDFFDAVANAVAQLFQVWLGMTQISIQGTGPVPTFAPPFVPVGPVLGGNVIPKPGSLV